MKIETDHWMPIIALGVFYGNSGVFVAAGTAQSYTSNAVAAIKALNQEWYGVKTGLWDNMWWNSANTFTTLADFGALRLTEANELNIGGYLQNTFSQAQKTNTRRGLATARTSIVGCLEKDPDCALQSSAMERRGFAEFVNEYYDDEGWWALGLIRSYDVSANKEYLAAAIRVFDDMQTGTGTPCNGGIYWNKDRKYVSAISNELYLAVSASLARRAPRNDRYRIIAVNQWNWFEKSGMINAHNLINDGLGGDCKNNGRQTWSYNQGVVLGGLVELFQLTLDTKYIEKATTIATAAITALSDSNGILTETDRCELAPSRCGSDGQQFKGVFIRNLRYLYDVAPSETLKIFILHNADSIWKNNRNENNLLGVAWGGQYIKATVATQSSALDALVAAIAVA